jgi:hypothetical protein
MKWGSDDGANRKILKPVSSQSHEHGILKKGVAFTIPAKSTPNKKCRPQAAFTQLTKYLALMR